MLQGGFFLVFDISTKFAMEFSQQAISDIRNIISQAKDSAIRQVDFERIMMYWHIGRRIFEEEQQGKDRANYGTYLIRYLSEQLQPEFREWIRDSAIKLFQAVLHCLSNCARTAVTIELDSV